MTALANGTGVVATTLPALNPYPRRTATAGDARPPFRQSFRDDRRHDIQAVAPDGPDVFRVQVPGTTFPFPPLVPGAA